MPPWERGLPGRIEKGRQGCRRSWQRRGDKDASAGRVASAPKEIASPITTLLHKLMDIIQATQVRPVGRTDSDVLSGNSNRSSQRERAKVPGLVQAASQRWGEPDPAFPEKACAVPRNRNCCRTPTNAHPEECASARMHAQSRPRPRFAAASAATSPTDGKATAREGDPSPGQTTPHGFADLAGDTLLVFRPRFFFLCEGEPQKPHGPQANSPTQRQS